MDPESPVPVDSALIESFQRGSPAERQRAFHALYERYAGPIQGYLGRLTREPPVAEDLTQETFLRALKALRRFQGQSSFKTWIYCIATNLFKDHLRRRDTMSRKTPFMSKETTAPSPDELAEREEEAMRVRAAVDALPPDYRAAITLVRIEGLSYQGAADALGVNLTTLRMRVHRAHWKLVEALR